MDFHTFARRDLQALCKKNKIPANLTNVAMADALTALQKVEGLDEFGNAQHSPERSANGEPRTAGRTSTRRKPVNVESESSLALTRSRRTTIRTVADNESKNVDLPETPAISNRRRAPAASTRRKIDSQLSECSEVQEKSDMGIAKTPAAVSTRRNVKTQKDEKSVAIVSSKRQSVRLLEKTMASLNLKEERNVEAVKIEGLCDESEQVEQAKDKNLPADESMESECEKYEAVENSKPNDDEVDQLPENECEMVDEDNKSEVVDCDESENIDEFLGNEGETKVEPVEGSGAKLETETCANSDSLTVLDDAEENNDSSDTDIQVETSDEANDMIHESIDENQVEASDKAIDMIHEIIDENQVEASDKAIDMIHESIDEKGSDAETENPEKMMNSDLEKETEKESEYESKENSSIVMEADNTESLTDVLDEISDLVKETEDWIKSSEMNQQPIQKEDELDAIDAQISVDLDDCDKITQSSSVKQKSPLSPALVSDSENAAAAAEAKMATSVEQKSPFFPLVSDSKIAAAATEMTTSDDEIADIVEKTADNEFTGIVETCMKEANLFVSSPFAGNTIPGQFPRPTVEKKMMLVDDDMNINVNKENNMEESEGVKLSELSLRKLTKAVKEKLQIKNKKASKVGETRTALQKLPENAAEAEA